MKSIALSKNSWHYRLANTYAGKHYMPDYPTDFCTYFGNVMSGVGCVLLIIMFSSMWLGGLVNAAIWAFVRFTTETNISLDDYGFGMTALTAVICIFAAWVWLKYRYLEHKYKRDNIESTPSFITLAYRKIRDKMCFTVELK